MVLPAASIDSDVAMSNSFQSGMVADILLPVVYLIAFFFRNILIEWM